jgi:hypothetical protein
MSPLLVAAKAFRITVAVLCYVVAVAAVLKWLCVL